MKTFLLITLISAFFTGCSSSNAFSKFNLTPEQAKGENSMLSSKIYAKGKTVGVLSAIYLNQVFPKTYHENEVFYVSLYLKNSLKGVAFSLNGEEALHIEELKRDNKFSSLLPSKEKWKKYYLVEFKKEGKNLTLLVKTQEYKSDALLYFKDL